MIAETCEAPEVEQVSVAESSVADKSASCTENLRAKQVHLKKFLDKYEREGREVFARRTEIVAACQVRPGMMVGDIGAGTGPFTRLFAAEVGRTGKVYAVDIDPTFIEHIEKSCKEEGITNALGVLCTPDSVELPPESIDLAFVCDTYHHFNFPARTMASIQRALRPRGRLVLIDFQRIEGTSPERLLGHVRAGQEVFIREIESAGFRVVAERSFLMENYFIVFEKTAVDQPREPAEGKTMLDVLQAVERELPRLLQDQDSWNSVYVDYHPPIVERLWRQWGDCRVSLHRIHPCAQGEALFHPHPWPSAMHILSGEYEMAVGYGKGNTPPPIAARMIASGDFRYEMTDPDAWHYVRPIGGAAMTLMVTGPPWDRPSPRSEKPLRALTQDEKAASLRFFRERYR